MFEGGVNLIEVDYWNLEQLLSRMHPPYNESERYEGASRYVTTYNVICSSKQLRKKK